MQRDYMIEYRKEHGIDIQRMAKKCRISKTLLRLLEENDQEVTHPNIAERVSRAYKLTKKQTEGLMPEHYRKSSPNYNPDLYRRNDLECKHIAIIREWHGETFM